MNNTLTCETRAEVPVQAQRGGTGETLCQELPSWEERTQTPSATGLPGMGYIYGAEVLLPENVSRGRWMDGWMDGESGERVGEGVRT